MKTEKITRVEIIDRNGRAYVKNDCMIELRIQDEGRTLKIFVCDITGEPYEEMQNA